MKGKEMNNFDQLAERYEETHSKNIRISGYDPSYFDQQKIRELTCCLPELISREINFLNFGCGIGKSEQYIRHAFPKSFIYSVDVSGASISLARKRNEALTAVQFQQFDGAHIPFTEKFDIICGGTSFITFLGPA